MHYQAYNIMYLMWIIYISTTVQIIKLMASFQTVSKFAYKHIFGIRNTMIRYKVEYNWDEQIISLWQV